jgi:ABC-2 type transport system ATP-binding protein
MEKLNQSSKLNNSENIIEIAFLTKKYENFTAVDNISFSIKKGEIFAFLGPNGAGKTTTIKMLTTILKPSEGTAHVNGHDINKHKNLVRKSFGIVFQDFSVDDELTAYENMDFHAVLYHVKNNVKNQRIDSLMKFVDLSDKKKMRVKKFSGGMKKRLEIARALIHHPHILFLDEPTAGLDAQTRNSMWNHIKNLTKEENMTVFFTTHYIEEAEKYADRVAIIDKGKIIKIGTPDELKKTTKKKTLEDAFLKLTGKSIREEESTAVERMRQHSKVWRH